MTSASRATPGFERCERPSRAPDSTAGDQPGRLAQGPDEKHGLAGRRVGPARRIGMRAADRADEVIDERFIAPMPDFEETAGGAQFVHVSSRGVRGDITSRLCNAWLQIVNI